MILLELNPDSQHFAVYSSVNQEPLTERSVNYERGVISPCFCNQEQHFHQFFLQLMGPEEAKTHLLENFGCRVDKKSLDYFGLYSIDGASGNRKVSK